MNKKDAQELPILVVMNDVYICHDQEVAWFPLKSEGKYVGRVGITLEGADALLKSIQESIKEHIKE